MKKMFLKSSKTVVESLKDFYESSGYLKNYKECKWKKDRAPEYYCYYYKFTSNLIMFIDYGCSMKNYGTTPTAKLEEITVAFRDGVTEYALIKEKLNELKEERSKVKKSKKLDEQIEWLEYLNRNIKRILPKFSKYFEFNTYEEAKQFLQQFVGQAVMDFANYTVNGKSLVLEIVEYFKTLKITQN